MPMSRRVFNEALQLVTPKNQDRNVVSAAFHMVTISLISMSLVDLNWFTISGGKCIPYIVLSDFFTGFFNQDMLEEDDETKCISWTTAFYLRMVITGCIGCMVVSLTGFFLDLLGAKSEILILIRKYSLTSCVTVILIMGIIGLCYYIAVNIQDSLVKLYPSADTSVSYGFGFYLIAATGGISLLGTFSSLILTHSPSASSCQSDEGCLIDNDVDALNTFHSPPPPPPYNVPPPPYTP